MSNLAMQIAHLAPCSDARKWLNEQNTWQEAWNSCPRADWLLWLIGKDKSIAKKRIVVCACAIARTSLRFVKEGELRPLIAIETAERWAKGEATLDEVNQSRHGAYASNAAYPAAAAAYAADAAYAAAYASNAAAYAAYPDAAAYASNAAAYAAAADAADAADAAAYASNAAAAAAYAADAAYAAAYASNAAADAAYSADAAAYASNAATADAAYAADADRADTYLENAKIVRQFFPVVPNVLKPLEEGAKS